MLQLFKQYAIMQIYDANIPALADDSSVGPGGGMAKFTTNQLICYGSRVDLIRNMPSLR